MPPTDGFENLADREILIMILESQLRVETLVTQTLESAGPMIQSLSSGGILGMLRRA